MIQKTAGQIYFRLEQLGVNIENLKKINLSDSQIVDLYQRIERLIYQTSKEREEAVEI